MKKILVIEDEAAINDLICMNLEIAGYAAIPFFDGEVSRSLLLMPAWSTQHISGQSRIHRKTMP